MNISKVSGIILSVYPLGESDKNLTILTKERGKIQVVSRGCRRTNHPLFAASNEYVYGEFVIAEGRVIKYLNSAEIHMSFSNLRESLESICYSSYFCELASWFTMEGQDEREILNLLYLTFVALGKKLLPYPLIRRIFELKILQFHGMGIQSYGCVHCGKTEDLNYLSFEEGGVLCEDCRKAVPSSKIDARLLYVLQFLTGCRINEIYSFTLQEDVFLEFDWIVKRFFKTHVEHRFRSEQMLDMV